MTLGLISSKYSQYQTIFFPTPEQEKTWRIAENRGFKGNAMWSTDAGMAICTSAYVVSNMAFATCLRGRIGTILKFGATATFVGMTVWGVDGYVRTKYQDYRNAETYLQ